MSILNNSPRHKNVGGPSIENWLQSAVSGVLGFPSPFCSLSDLAPAQENTNQVIIIFDILQNGGWNDNMSDYDR